MSILLPYLYIICISFSLMSIFKKDFAEVILLSFIIPVFLLYIFGLLGNIKIGLDFSYILSLVWIPFIIKGFINKTKNIKYCFNKICNVSFIIFSIFFIFISIYLRYSSFSMWDEFSHWGPMVKEMYRLNKLYSVNESYLSVHKDYPPFTSLLELLWCYLSRGYKESYIYRSVSIFSFSFIIPIFNKNFKENKHYLFYSIFSSILFFLTFFLGFNGGEFKSNFFTIYIDPLCGLFSAYILYFVMKIDTLNGFNLFKLILYLSTLLLIKQVNIAFYLIIVFYVIIKFSFINKNIKKSKLLLLIIPLFIYFTWSLYVKQFNINAQFSISNILTLVNHSANYSLKHTTNLFINALFNNGIISFHNISYPISCLIFTILVVYLFYILNGKKEAILALVTCIIGAIGYVIMMLLLYLTCFSSEEVERLASFERYMSTFIYFLIMLFVFLFIHLCLSKQTKSTFISLLLMCFITPFAFGDNINKIKSYPTGYKSEYSYNELISQIDEYIDSNDEVLIITQYKEWKVELVLKYLYPDYNFSFIGIGTEDPSYDVNMTYEEWQTYYSNYTFVYTFITNEDFYQNYWLNKQDEPLYNDRFYVPNENKQLTLVPWLSSEYQ